MPSSSLEFGAIIEIASEAIIVMNPSGQVSEWNHAAESLFGYSRLEACGRNLHQLIVPERYRTEYERGIHAFCSSGTGPAVGKMLILSARKKNGEELLIELALSAIQLEANWYSVGLIRDVSEREQERARMLSKLEEAVAVRNELLSVASHELKTPMTALIIQLQLLRNMFEAKQEPQVLRKLIDGADREAVRIAQLLDRLLDLSWMQSTPGALALQKSPVNLAELTEQVALRFSAEAKQLGVLVSLNIENRPLGNWDGARIDQIVTNLFSNALKYGAGTPIEITVFTDSAQKMAIVSVADRGPGIPAAMQDRLFRRFMKMSRQSTGMGLGLYIARQIAEAHGGLLSLVSQEGRGSTFTLSLPIAT